MTQEKLLEGLKKDVRSLLVSAKGGLALEQLKRDYLKMLGHPLPLVALGYRNVLDMVRDMPDVVALSCSEDGTTLLKAIGNDSTKGIEQLVAKQRSSTPKEYARRLGVVPGYHRGAQPAQVLPRRGQAPPTIPAQLHSQLRQLLSQGPVMLSELEACFFKRFGRPLQVMHYGFYSFAEMLAAASDLVTIEQGRRGSLISLKSDMRSLNYAEKWTSTRLQQELTTKPTQDSVVKDKSRLLSNWASRPVLLNNIGPNVSPGDGKPHTEGPQFQPEPAQEEKAFENCIEKLEEQLKSQILECGAGGAVSPQLKKKLRQVVAQSGDGISIHELPGEFKKMFGEDLPMAQCGFLSVTEMVGALSDTLHLKPGHGNDGNHWIITDIQHRHINEGGEEDKGPDTVEPALDLNPSKNYSCYGDSPWEEKHGDKKLSSEVMEDETNFKVANKSFHQMVDIFPAMPLQLNGGGAVPLDALRDQKLRPAPRWQERALVAVLVERVESPNHFYIRFDGTPESRTLENMMIEMRTCYTCPEVSERYRLPQNFVRPGQVCCLAPRDVWFYRVIIHRVLNDSQVEVYYVDYGDRNTVDWRNLKFLKSCYSKLPAQAVLSSLIGIQPISGSWSKSSISYFQKLCCERPLVAIIHSYHKDVLHVFLCDTHTEEDVYIHTALMTEGHASYCPPSDSQHVTCAVRAEEDISDLPDLEVIDIAEATRTAQAIPANLFGGLLCTEQSCFENPEQGSTAERNSRDVAPKMEVNQNENHGDEPSMDTVGRDAAVLDVLGMGRVGQPPVASPPPAPATPPPTLLPAGESAQAGDYGGVAPSVAVSERTQSFMFSLFAPGGGVRSPQPSLRHVPPSFLGPAARLAAGTPFLNWHCHKAS